MTRLSIPSEDVLGENYTITNITASEYNPTIDSTVTVTITVKDVYDDPVENKYVTITCNIGKFTKLNNQTISDTQSVTAQTDSNGEISLTYTCSEWGLVTFSANNTSTQVNVQGWRKITSGTGQLWVNNATKTAAFYFTRTGAITSEISYADAIPSGYRPYSYVRMIAHNSTSSVIKLGVESNGTVRLTSSSYGSTSVSVAAWITYAYF